MNPWVSPSFSVLLKEYAFKEVMFHCPVNSVGHEIPPCSRARAEPARCSSRRDLLEHMPRKFPPKYLVSLSPQTLFLQNEKKFIET